MNLRTGGVLSGRGGLDGRQRQAPRGAQRRESGPPKGFPGGAHEWEIFENIAGLDQEREADDEIKAAMERKLKEAKGHLAAMESAHKAGDIEKAMESHGRHMESMAHVGAHLERMASR